MSTQNTFYNCSLDFQWQKKLNTVNLVVNSEEFIDRRNSVIYLFIYYPYRIQPTSVLLCFDRQGENEEDIPKAVNSQPWL